MILGKGFPPTSPCERCLERDDCGADQIPVPVRKGP
jgi:hypothetical protein